MTCSGGRKKYPRLHPEFAKPKSSRTKITCEARPCRESDQIHRVQTWNHGGHRLVVPHADGARFLRALFKVFDRHHTSVDMVATSEVSVSLTLDDVSALDAISQDLRQLGDVKSVRKSSHLPCRKQSEVHAWSGAPGVRQPLGYQILMVSHGASNINFSFLIDEKMRTRRFRNSTPISPARSIPKYSSR